MVWCNLCLNDFLHNPRMDRHPVQTGTKTSQISQCFQMVSQAEIASHHLMLFLYSTCTMDLTETSLTLSVAAASAFISRWAVFHPLFDWDPSLFTWRGGGQDAWATPCSSCSRCVGASASDVSAYLLSVVLACMDLILFCVWLYNFPLPSVILEKLWQQGLPRMSLCPQNKLLRRQASPVWKMGPAQLHIQWVCCMEPFVAALSRNICIFYTFSFPHPH